MKNGNLATGLALAGAAATVGVKTMFANKLNDYRYCEELEREEEEQEDLRKEEREARRRGRRHRSPPRRNDDRSKQLVRLPRRNEIRSSESEDDSEESTVDSYPNHRDDGRAHASHPLNHGFQTRNAAAPKPTTQDYWTLDYAAQKYYHDDVEKGIRHFPDGKTEYLAPPTPSAPVMKWDTRNQDWYWRDDFNKCWRYSRGLVIDYPAE